MNAETLTLTFEDLPWLHCGTEWTMSGLTMRLLPLNLGCETWNTSSGWYLGNACLEVDLRSLADLQSVSLEILNYAEPGDAYLFLMDATVPLFAAYSQVSGQAEWLASATPGGAVTRLRLFHPRGLLLQAVFEHGGLPTGPTAWGHVKALYR